MGGQFRGRRRPFRPFVPLNDEIRQKELRVIDHNGDNLGVISKEEALRIAQEVGLDLFVIAEKADIPVAKIMDYGKYKFQKEKQEKHSKKKKQVGTEIKEIKMRYNIDIGDYNTRLKQAKTFLEALKKVKLNITLRGREVQHARLAEDLAAQFLNDLIELGHTDMPIRLMGRSVVIYISPGADKEKVKKAKEKADLEAQRPDKEE